MRRLLSALREIISPRLRKSDHNQAPLSIVLLQRNFNSLDQAILDAAADRAWNLGLSQGRKPEKYFVKCHNTRSVMLVGKGLLHIIQQNSPYLNLSEKKLQEFLPDPARRDLWRAHRSWVAIDWHGTPDVELANAILAGLASELLDPNVVGTYTPRLQTFSPNDDSLYSSLKQIAKSREVIIT